jgi:type I restriction enzyme S subunit
MSDLKKYNLSDAAEVITGFPFKGEKYAPTGIRVVRGENVTLGNLRWDTIKCWNEPFKEIDKYSLREGDIVIGMDGSRVGRNRAQIRKEDLPLILAQRVARLRAKKNFAQDFLAYVIKSNLFEQYVEAIKTGTSIPHISPQQIKEFEFIAPGKETQYRIASILSSLDNKIELNRQTNQTLEAIAQTLFKEMCLPNGGELPDGWRVGTLKEIIEINPKLALKKSIIARYIEMKDLSEDSAIIKRYLDREFSSGSKFQNGDTLLARITPCLENGKTGLVDLLEDNEVGWGSTEFIVLRGKKQVGSYFVYCLSRLQSFRDFAIQSMVGSSGRQRVVDSILAEFELVVPSDKILIEFHHLVKPLFKNIFSNYKETQTLAAIRDSLLPKLMKGEIELN